MVQNLPDEDNLLTIRHKLGIFYGVTGPVTVGYVATSYSIRSPSV